MGSGSQAEGIFYRGQCLPWDSPFALKGSWGHLGEERANSHRLLRSPFGSNSADNKTQWASEEGTISYPGLFGFIPPPPASRAPAKQRERESRS